MLVSIVLDWVNVSNALKVILLIQNIFVLLRNSNKRSNKIHANKDFIKIQ